MVGKSIRLLRASDAISDLCTSGNGAIFLTLTTPDVVDFAEIRRRWRSFRHDFVRLLGKSRYIMNYEVHPHGHGWHIHSVWDRFIDLRIYLPRIHSHGFGRVDVQHVSSLGVAEYLSKHCLKAYRGATSSRLGVSRIRLVNQSRGLPLLSDYHWESSSSLVRSRLFLQFLNWLVSFGINPSQRIIRSIGRSVDFCLSCGVTDFEIIRLCYLCFLDNMPISKYVDFSCSQIIPKYANDLSFLRKVHNDIVQKTLNLL